MEEQPQESNQPLTGRSGMGGARPGGGAQPGGGASPGAGLKRETRAPRVCPNRMSAAVGGALGRSGRGGRRRTRLRSPTGSGLGRPPSRVVETLCRRNFPSPFPRRHPPRRRFGGTGRDFRFRAGGAGLVGSVGGGRQRGGTSGWALGSPRSGGTSSASSASSRRRPQRR